eukprot:283510_1
MAGMRSRSPQCVFMAVVLGLLVLGGIVLMIQSSSDKNGTVVEPHKEEPKFVEPLHVVPAEEVLPKEEVAEVEVTGEEVAKEELPKEEEAVKLEADDKAQKAEVQKFREKVQMLEAPQPNPFLVKFTTYGGTLTMQYSPSILAELQKDEEMIRCIVRFIAFDGSKPVYLYSKYMGVPRHADKDTFLEFTFLPEVIVQPGASTVEVEFWKVNSSGRRPILKLNKVPIVEDDKPLKV